MTADTTAGLPCSWNSTLSSPVKLRGALKYNTMALSIGRPSRPRIVLLVAMRSSGIEPPSSINAVVAPFPEIRTTATPLGTVPLDSANMVSDVIDNATVFPNSYDAESIRRRIVRPRYPYGSWEYDYVPGPNRNRHAFIESKKSPFVFTCFNLSIRNSIASVVPIGERMRRRTNIFCRSWRRTSRSSLRVPDFRMSIAG